jgi:hypothetical protein
VRRLLQAADAHAAAAAATLDVSSISGGAQQRWQPEQQRQQQQQQRLQLDVSSCRGLERGVRQAASKGMQQLRAALGLR